MWHLNLYQQEGDFLQGDDVPGANESINVEESQLFPFDDIMHTDIDEAMEILDWIMMRYLQQVTR
jgi:hypothetical protein